MAPLIFPRQMQFGNTLGHYVVGSLVVGGIIFVVLLCIRLCFLCFKRTKTSKMQEAATLYLESRSETNSVMSRDGLMSNDMPEKAIIRNESPDHSSEFSPRPSSPTYSLQLIPPSHSRSFLRPVHVRHSRASSGFSGFTVYNHYCFPPGLTRPSRLSLASFRSSIHPRPVHQCFDPTLPDELALQCGEYITVLRSFDDGWCVVARDTSPSSPVSLLSAGTRINGDNADIGIVPAWVFAEPLEDVACTRRFRSTSLNALRFGQNPGYARDTIMSAEFA